MSALHSRRTLLTVMGLLFLAGMAAAEPPKPSGELETTLQHFTQVLAQSEKVLAADPDSAQAARIVAVNLTSLGNFLVKRGKPGDSEAALKYFLRRQAILDRQVTTYCENFAISHPEALTSALNAATSMEQLGDFLAKRGQPGDAEAALKYYTRSLEYREEVLAAFSRAYSSHTLIVVRDSSLSRRTWTLCRKLAEYAEKTGQGDAQVWWRRAYEILNDMPTKGMSVDPAGQQLHKQLQARFGDGK